LFSVYSWQLFGQMLPSYFTADWMTFECFGEALAGNLFSPGRGLFVYVPITAFVIYLLLRYRAYLAHGRLAVLSASVILVHWITISGFAHWHGGHGYGSRLMTGVVPWLVLLAILGLQAMLCWRKERESVMDRAIWLTQNSVGALLLTLSVIINGVGATSRATSAWNSQPEDVDRQPSRVWDWRHPQFLAEWQK
jgi:hypothetical protein